MNKTLLYIMTAAGIIASGAALADSANVEVYGTLNVDFENVKATGGTAAQALPAGQMGTAPTGVVQPARNRVTSNSSNIGFRGNEDLGMGLKAIFQVESGISMDSAATTTTTAGTTSTGFFGTRNTNVGLSSSTLGTVFYGNWDTPYKALTNPVTFSSFYATGIADVNTLIGTPGFNVATITTSVRNGNAGDASFDRRQGNSVQYWTPNWAGLSARLAYSANEGRANEPAPATGNISPTIYSASLRYEYGPFTAAYSFEQHRDYFGLTQLGGAASSLATNNTSRDNGNKATLSYKLWDTTQLNVAFEQLAYNNSDSAGSDLIHYHRNLVYFAGKHQIGANTFRMGFGNAWAGSCKRADASVCSTTGLDAKHYALGYSYSFSKRTDLYAFWTRVNNGQFATYQLGNGAGLSAAAGNHSQGFGLGFRHVF